MLSIGDERKQGSPTICLMLKLKFEPQGGDAVSNAAVNEEMDDGFLPEK